MPSPSIATGPVAPAVAERPAGRSVTIAGRRYPILLPKLRDPRLHVAAVIISVQVLGQAVLGFDVSIAQILLAIGTAAVIELIIVGWSRQEIAWPASALLTGNGVALILRTPGTVHGEWWSVRGWPIFVAAAGLSLLSKYALRAGVRHVFNPSNFGLVVVFLVFGFRRADPQNLWWGPWSTALAVTFVVILVGGFTLARRLRLFSVALTFWAVFAAGVAVLALRGHAMTARWHVGAVTGWSYWWVLIASPEIVIFVFFMITDPRTAPENRVARLAYAASIGLLASVLVAFQRTEFATKVSVLGALAIVCLFRPLLDRALPDARFAGPGTRWWRTWGAQRWRPTLAGAGALVVAGAVSAGAIAAAGSGTRSWSAVALPGGAPGGVMARPAVGVAARAVPRPVVARALGKIDGAMPPAEARRAARDVVEDLVIEDDAVAGADRRLASPAAFGPELAAIGSQIRAGRSAHRVAVTTHQVRRVTLVLLKSPGNPQALPQVGILLAGRVTTTTRSGSRSGPVQDRRTSSFRALYLVTKVSGHYLIGQQLPTGTPMVVGGLPAGS